MARQVRRISELPEATELTGDELLEIVQDGGNKRVTVDQLSGGDAVLRQDLSNPDKGASMVAYGEGTVADKLDEIVSGAVTEPIVDAKVLAHNHDPAAHPELRSSIVSEVSAHVTSEANRAETAADAAFVNADVYPDVALV